jgi:DNA-binding CsgD family transcriptional regulator
VSLIRHLKESGIDLPFVVSCGETMLAKEFSPSITNLKTNYIEFGKAGVQAAKVLRKNHDVNSVSIYLSGEIVPGATTEFLPVAFEAESKSVVEEDYEDRFYEDAEVDEMLKLEKLFNQCERNDLELLRLLLSGLTYSEIAERLYMSTNGIKYKLKGMYELCGVSSRSEFLKLMGKYI